MKQTNKERIKKLEKKMEQLKAKQSSLLKQERDKQRKERTRRLIQNGALAEQYLQSTNIQPQEFDKLLQSIVNIDQVKELLYKTQA